MQWYACGVAVVYTCWNQRGHMPSELSAVIVYRRVVLSVVDGCAVARIMRWCWSVRNRSGSGSACQACSS
jgi:hypothetical protein